MESLPDELLDQILNYLSPQELSTLQSVSKRLLKLARDNHLWLIQCFYDVPGSHFRPRGRSKRNGCFKPRARQPEPSPPVSPDESVVARPTGPEPLPTRDRARSLEAWDLSDPSESTNWHAEYIARHAELSVDWMSPSAADNQDVRGITLFDDSTGAKKLLGSLDDGTLSIWDLTQHDRYPLQQTRISETATKSRKGLLWFSLSGQGKAGPFPGTTDCISVDSTRNRAYVAVHDLLKEVDLNTLGLVSQTKYAWPITALSEVQQEDHSVTVGTNFSLHILDHRCCPRERSPAENQAAVVESIAFLPNKDSSARLNPARKLDIHPIGGFGSGGFEIRPNRSRPTTPRPARPYAPLEPAPLSILHQTPNSIMVAGRFPSILNYDRRFFPRLEYVIHSSARLSSLVYLPFSPRAVKAASTSELHGTLISGGEYNGRGSLEVYAVPRNAEATQRLSYTETENSTEPASKQSTHRRFTPIPPALREPGSNGGQDISSFKNRQSISSSKVLSVATQGTRIVFSDADGGLKWVERDGKSVVREWNVNDQKIKGRRERSRHEEGEETQDPGEEVVRMIVPTGSGEADDLLVWTGEKVGVVGFGGRDEWVDAEEGVAGPSKVNESGDGGEQLNGEAREYDRQMRRALERQADELNWMTRFGLGPG